MKNIQTRTDYQSGMSFKAEFPSGSGSGVVMDASVAAGGQSLGPTPKELVLAGICGCSGMDVVSLLRKMRVEFESFYIKADTFLTEGHPSVFHKVRLEFHFLSKGEVEGDKLVKAVTMSMTKYCGVSAMIARVTDIDFGVFLNGVELHSSRASF